MPRSRQLLDAVKLEPLPASNLLHGTSSIHAALTVPGEFKSLLSEFSEVIGFNFSSVKQQHRVCHHLHTSGPLIFSKPSRLDPEKLESARPEFQAMEEASIKRRSNSSWASPLHMVP